MGKSMTFKPRDHYSKADFDQYKSELVQKFEQKANREIERYKQELEFTSVENASVIVQMIIYLALHEEFGFGAVRIKRLLNRFMKYEDIIKSPEDLDDIYNKLLAIGVEVDPSKTIIWTPEGVNNTNEQR